MKIENSMALALNKYCAHPCAPGGFLVIPPAQSRSDKLILGDTPHDNELVYSLASPKSCPDDGVYRLILEYQVAQN